MFFRPGINARSTDKVSTATGANELQAVI